jgi:hypothetical protein
MMLKEQLTNGQLCVIVMQKSAEGIVGGFSTLKARTFSGDGVPN